MVDANGRLYDYVDRIDGFEYRAVIRQEPSGTCFVELVAPVGCAAQTMQHLTPWPDLASAREHAREIAEDEMNGID